MSKAIPVPEFDRVVKSSRELFLDQEVERLLGWLRRIEGGDNPCTDESQLRQWAYEAVTLNRQP